jgi:glycolate oxidase iron-sulfur subunit
VTSPPPPPDGTPRADAATRAFDDVRPPSRAILDDCVHCGFCLPTCPTYVLWGEEMDSPRGRILLIDRGERGEAGLDAQTVQHLDSCLGCMACVTACPSGVRYDRLIEQARAQVERRFERPPAERARRRALFAVLPHHRRLAPLAAGLVAYRASGLQRVVRGSGLRDRLPAPLRDAERLAPTLPAAALGAAPPLRTAPQGPRRLRVALLLGCVQRAFFGDVNAATARVLAAYGCEVVAPRDQGCCGALELHAGRDEPARERARRLIARMERLGADVVVTNAAGCGSALKEYGHLLADDPAHAAAAAAFAARVRDVSEVLAGLEPQGRLAPLPLRVAYHDACHLRHAQGVADEPRAVLAQVPGLELVELAERDLCCGSAGVYNLLEPAAAADLGARKAATVAAVAPDALVAANPGCLIQIGAHLAQRAAPVPAFHPVELLDAALAGRSAAELLATRRALIASAG